MRAVKIYDATLREGAQGREISFTLQDKINITLKLDELGVHYIEGGWPSSNPKDLEYFKRVKNYTLRNSVVTAFGSTKRKGSNVQYDPSLNAMVSSEVGVATLVCPASRFHAEKVLKADFQAHVDMVYDSITYLKAHGIDVIFDAEHFYTGYKLDPEYALNILKAAEEAGAIAVVLCDTNGGSLPHEVYDATKSVAARIKSEIGVHCHNDGGLAVANTVFAVMAGASQVQGTVNGFGERCGNADLCQVIPTLELKLGIKTLGREGTDRLRYLTQLSRYVYELANVPINPYQPYVGKYAFAHKAGIHVDALSKTVEAYEHVDPMLVGNVRLITISELSGKTSIALKARELGIEVGEDDPAILNALKEIKDLEYRGYQLENANATLALILLKHLRRFKKFFEVLTWKTVTEGKNQEMAAESSVKVKVDNELMYEIAEGTGPVHAQDLALRKALVKYYPEVRKVSLTNYKVSVIDTGLGTASTVRVYVEFSDGKETWATIGVSTNILEASKNALTDGYLYFLHKAKDLIK